MYFNGRKSNNPRGGHGHRRGGGRPHPGDNRAPTGVCHQFQKNGSCSFGKACKFSHQPAASSNQPQHRNGNGNQRTAPQAGRHPVAANKDTPPPSLQGTKDRVQYSEFMRLLRRGPGTGPASTTALLLWKYALHILDGDDQDMQQLLVRQLVDDDLGGWNYMASTIGMSEGESPTSLAAAVAFLKVITHTSLLDPMSIDSFVSRIYNFFGGANADRALNFVSRLSDVVPVHHGEAKLEIGETTLLMANAMARLFERVPKSIFHERVLPVLDKLEDLAGTAPPSEDARAAKTRIAFSRKTAKRYSKVPSLDDSGGVPLHGSIFPMHLETPGGKHDNDFADIAQIAILPTVGEVRCVDVECLPSTDLRQPHFLTDPVQRHIDSTFRLLRHDIFGPVKDVIRDLLAQDVSNPSAKLKISVDSGARMYTQARVTQVFVDRGGLELAVSFSVPPQLRKKSEKDQRAWWDESSRLEEQSLVAFVLSQGDFKAFLFLEITVKRADKPKDHQRQISLVTKNQQPSIGAKLAAFSQPNLDLLFRAHSEKLTGVIVEFHGLLPATFAPVLSNLKQMFVDGELAFRDVILPPDDVFPGQVTGPVAIEPPAYARRANFSFSLDPISKVKGLSIKPTAVAGGGGDIDYAEIEDATGLDFGQCKGLVAALSREYALIQGPPGTGKSYLGVQLVRVLLHNKKRAKLGPILVICYTNHALDQFLMHLLEAGIKSIIRIGGRCQTPELEGHNLRAICRNEAKTFTERKIIGESHGRLDDVRDTAGYQLKPLHQLRSGPTWDIVQGHLRTLYPDIYKQLQPVDEEGFTRVGRDPLKVWLGRRPKTAKAAQHNYRDLEQRAATNILSLSLAQRWALADKWLQDICQEQSESLFETLSEYTRHKKEIDNVHDGINRRALLGADVIGITTSGLARNINMLRHVRPKVVICEEAAEVMEAHIISAFMPGVEHLIQIGDHRQLRPQINNYSLSMESTTGQKWQLDRSQFERRAMGEPGMAPAPVAQLDVQRRMRPEISRLIRTVYPKLRDHESVRSHPSVAGMRENLFWLHHTRPEESRDDGALVKSHSNNWEVGMAVALAKHLVRQGEYSSTDIAMLTPYTGQLRKLRAALSKDFEVVLGERDIETLAKEDVESGTNGSALEKDAGQGRRLEKKQLSRALRVATVDNFQGEEAKVIIVSLVRSNQTRKVGFLRTENRINVLLSRAKHGMYLIGNSETYMHVAMWEDVRSQLAAVGAVDEAFPLCCPRHPGTAILCATPEDFILRSPEGGCDLACDQRLEPCGHRCFARCHSALLHDAVVCHQPCPRIRETCNHTCPKFCGETCGPCQVPVFNIKLPCGHVVARLSCNQTLNLARVECPMLVSKKVPRCGHVVQVQCGLDVSLPVFACTAPCTKILGCGDKCPGSCGSCEKIVDGSRKVQHAACAKICERPFGSCSHRCTQRCHKGQSECGSCDSKCEVRCPHSRCPSKCGKGCVPCIEPCTWFCAHQGACTMPCAAPCNRLPCDKRCDKILPCGHQCPTYCGEVCPVDAKLCQECGDRGDALVDFYEGKTYAEVDLNETPIVFLSCRHFYTGNNLDMLVKLSEVYSEDPTTGSYTGLLDISGSLASRVPACPECRRPILQFTTKRYNRVVNKAVMDEAMKRFFTTGTAELEGLQDKFDALIRRAKKQRNKALSSQARAQVVTDGYEIKAAAETLRIRMGKEHQPSKQLHDAIVLKAREAVGLSLEERMQNLNVSSDAQDGRANSAVFTPVFDKQLGLKAHLIEIQTREFILCEATSKESKAALVSKKVVPERADQLLLDCDGLIAESFGANLPRVQIPAALSFAKVTLMLPNAKPESRTVAATRVSEAIDLCRTLPNGKELSAPLLEIKRLLDGPVYNEVTPEELAAIKDAMVSGPRGISTHSGHWYNCANGHPFAIGECGMPMELARCPECNAPIGGQNHEFVQGATRATEME